MPPPARLGFVLSRACLASRKVSGVGANGGGEDIECAVGEAGERTSADVSEREEIGFMKSLWTGSVGMRGSETVEFAFVFPIDDPAGGSTILIGTRRRFGDIEVDCDSVAVAV